MATYAVVFNNVIVNLVEWDGATPWVPPSVLDQVLPTAGVACGIGWTWNNGNPVNPNPPPVVQPPQPVVLTPAQGLAIIGITLTSLKAALASSA